MTADVADALRGMEPGPGSRERGVRLREAPVAERVLRCAIAALMVAYTVFALYEGLRRPRLIQDGSVHKALLADVAAGRVDRIDDSDRSYVLWRTRDGAVYAERKYDIADLRASVAAQPRGSAGEVAYGPIAAPPVDERDVGSFLQGVAVIACWVALRQGPQPRLATRWGWFWLTWTGVGAAAYVLLSGSRRILAPDTSRRLNGVAALVVLVVFLVVGTLGYVGLRTMWFPDPKGGAHAPAVLRHA